MGGDTAAYARRKFDSPVNTNHGELYPIPPPTPPAAPEGRSVHAQRRFNHKLRIWQEACHAIDALNLLYGCRRDRRLGESGCSPSLAQAHRQVHQHIIQRIAKMRPLAVPTGPAAARELFGSCYDYVGDSCSVVPYDQAKVSLPDGSLNPVMLADVLAEKTMGHLILSSMLADDDTVLERREFGAAPQYTDEAMRGDPGLLRDFSLRLLECGVAGVTSVKKDTVSPFFVKKKGDKQRLVLDCRRVNEIFRRPPSPDLGGGECFSRLCTVEREGRATGTVGPTEGDACAEQRKKVYFADADIKNCFYQCGMPGDWCDYFVLLEVDRAWLISHGFSTMINGEALPAAGPLYIALKVLPMGWTWSFYIVQALHEQLLDECGIDTSRCQAGGWPTPPLGEGPVAQPYCDNLQVLGYSADEVNTRLDKLVAHFSAKGFELHEVEYARTVAQPLGCHIDGIDHVAGPKPERAWRLKAAFEWLSSGRVVTGKQVQKLLGHFVADSMHRREALSCMRSLYDFVTDCYWEPTRLWDSCREECYMIAGVLPLLYSDFSKGWNTTVHAIDSSLFGWGVTSCTRDVAEVAEAGRWNERWRYKRLPPEEWAPRRRVGLDDPDPFADASTALEAPTLPHSLIPRPSELDWQEREGFPNPDSELPSWDWKVESFGKWRFHEHITQLEARALTTHLSRYLAQPHTHGLELLQYVDSFAVALSMSKGRGKSHGLLQSSRRVCALLLAANVGLHLRWLPSEWNPADPPSRYYEQDRAFRPPLFTHDARAPPGLGGEGPRTRSRNAWAEYRRAVAESRLSELSCAAGLTAESSAPRLSTDPALAACGRATTCAADHRPGGRRVGQKERFDGGRTALRESANLEGLRRVRRAIPRLVSNTSAAWQVGQRPPGLRDVPDGFGRSDVRGREDRERGHVFQICLAEAIPPSRACPPRSAARSPSQIAGAAGRGSGQCGGRHHGDVGVPAARPAGPHSDDRILATGGGDVASSRGHPPAQPGAGSAPSRVVGFPPPGGARGADQDRDFRRNNISGPSSRSRSSIGSLQKSVHAVDDALSVSAQSSGNGVARGGGGGRCTGVSDVPTAPRRRVRRSARTPQKHVSDPEPRPLEVNRKLPAVQQERAGAAVTRQAQRRPDGARHRVAQEPQGSSARHVAPALEASATAAKKSDALPAGFERMYHEGAKHWGRGTEATSTRGFVHERLKKGKALSAGASVELYGGCCGISRAIARHGGVAESYEILRSAKEDLTMPSQRRSLFARVRDRRLRSLWIGITCASWSRARRAPAWSRMPHALRDDHEHIYGLPGLSERDQLRVNDGNDSLSFVAKLIRLCLRHDVMVVVENPGGSRLWIAPEMASLLPRAASDHMVDYCAFGTEWRKTTRLVSWCQPLARLPPRCSGKKGFCSFSGCKHVQLEGFAGGQFKTAAASAYPVKMCRLLAPQLCSAV